MQALHAVGTAIPQGDGSEYIIAAASIVATVSLVHDSATPFPSLPIVLPSHNYSLVLVSDHYVS